MGITRTIGEWIEGIFEKAVENGGEKPTIKSLLLAFISGWLDGMAAWWAIFGIFFTHVYGILWIISKIRNIFGKKS